MNSNDDPKLPQPPPLGALGSIDPGELLARALNTAQPSPGVAHWTPPAPEELAALLPQYHIESLLGHGGMGAVYKGRQAALDRPVAIKLLPAELAADAQFIARFQREARTLAKLQHPGIVAVHDFGQTAEGHLYFVMEFVDGTDLHRILHTPADDPAQPALTPAQVLELISQICDALHYAHSRGVIHRDIKPGNILVTTESRAKLADFGLARPVAEESAMLTGTNVVMGTAAYMAPEQQEGHADQRADIYALGVMLYEMLCGQRPSGAFDPPSQRVQVDVRLDGVVLKAMQQQPERRYQQVSEMKTDVDRIRTTPMQKAESGRRKAESKARVRVAAIVAACLAVASATGFFIWKKANLSRIAHPETQAPASQNPQLRSANGATVESPGRQPWVHDAKTQRPEGADTQAPPNLGAPSAPSGLAGSPSATQGSAALRPGLSTVAPLALKETQPATEPWVRMWNEPEDHLAKSPFTVVAGWLVRRSGEANGTKFFPEQWRDGAIRAEFRWADEATFSGLRLRCTARNSYKLSRTKDAVLLAFADPSSDVRELKKGAVLKAYPANQPRDGETFTLELRAVGKTLVAKFDGQEVIRIEDESLPTGGPGLFLSRDGGMRNIEVLNLDQPAAAIDPQTVATAEAWVRKFDRAENHPADGVTRMEDGWILRSGEAGGRPVPGAFQQDGAIRAECRWAAGTPSAAFWLRISGTQRYTLLRDTEGVRIAYFNPQDRIVPLASYAIPEPQDGEVFTMEFRAVGRVLIGKLDGREVVRAEDDRLKSGGVSIYTMRKGGMRNIEVLSLDKPAAAAVSASPAAFQPGQWVKVFTKAEDLPEPATMKDGWITGLTNKLIPTLAAANVAVRATFKGTPSAGAPLRSGLMVRYTNKAPDYANYTLQVQKGDVAAIALVPMRASKDTTLQKGKQMGKKSVTLPPHQPYTMEFAVIGDRLIGRINGELLPIARDSVLTQGRLMAFDNEENAIRDIEVVNLDGLSEAEALKIAGVDEQGNNVRASATNNSVSPAVSHSPNLPVSGSSPAHPIHTFAGHRYQFVPEAVTWMEANAKAKAMGGHLVTVTTKEEDDWLKLTFAQTLQGGAGAMKRCWLGASAGAKGGPWKWVTEEPFEYQHWAKNQPDYLLSTGEPISPPYAAFVMRAWLWDDLPANGNSPGWFIVEWDDDGQGKPPPGGPRSVVSQISPTDAAGKVGADGAAPSTLTPATATKDAPFVNSLGMKFVPVPILGGPTGGQRVLFSGWETRVQDYEAFVKETKREWPEPGFEQGPTHPAVNVSWEDAQLFCQWLTERERKAGKLGATETYRLPSDHEWSCAVGIGEQEDAAKLPDDKDNRIPDAFPWGSGWPPPLGAGNYAGEELQPALDAGKYSNLKSVLRGYRDEFVETAPVGSFAGNRLGLHDLGGNVWEWCEDWATTEQTSRVLRGASWAHTIRGPLLSSLRSRFQPSVRVTHYGFRCVLAPSAPSAAKP